MMIVKNQQGEGTWLVIALIHFVRSLGNHLRLKHETISTTYIGYDDDEA